MTREYFFIIRPKYIFEMVLKKKKRYAPTCQLPHPGGEEPD